MCGLHGFMNGNTPDRNADDYVANGFFGGALRGVDSSGIASIDVSKQHSVAFHKLPVMGPMFVDSKVAGGLMRKASGANMLTLCHTRAATVGTVNIDNAHPFFIDEDDGKTTREMIGMHNGTLTGWSSKKHASRYVVDSEWALNHIYDFGPEAFEDFNGAFCFVWWDSANSNTLNIALNDQRTMYVGFTDKGNMAFASEAGMLYWLLERNNIKLDGAIIKLSPGNWYKFNRSNPKEFIKEKLAEAVVPVVVTKPTYSGSSYTPKSCMQKVKELLTKIGRIVETPATPLALPPPAPVAKLVPVATKPTTLNQLEVETARVMGLMGVRAIFRPITVDEDNDYVIGEVKLKDGVVFDAVIRAASTLDLEALEAEMEVDVPVVGVQDDGLGVVVICGRPALAKRLALVH